MDCRRVMAGAAFVALAAIAAPAGTAHAQGAGLPVCAIWDDPSCLRGAWSAATVDYIDHHRVAPISFPPSDLLASPHHGVHEWWPDERGGVAVLCGASELPRSEPPVAHTIPFASSYLPYADMSGDYALAPERPADIDADMDYVSCILAHYAIPQTDLWMGADHPVGLVPPAGLHHGTGNGTNNDFYYGTDPYILDRASTPWGRWAPVAGAQEADGVFHMLKDDLRDMRPVPTAVRHSPETITDENMLERRPVVNGSGTNTVPSVANVASLVPDGLYAYGERVEIGVQFTEAVSVSTTGGTPYLALDFAGERRAAPYVNGSGSDTLVFGYVVGYNDRHAGLNYTGPSALSDGGGTITGASGLHADLGLPAPGSPGSLSANSRLAIGVAPPRTVKPVVLFGAEGSAPGNFSGTLGVAVSPIDGSIVVADRENHRIQVFDPDGAFAFGLNSSGSAGGEFKFPRGVAVALDGRIAVADTGNHRIQVFHPNGTFDFKFTTHNGGGERLAPSDVAVDPRGWFVVGSVFDGRSTVSGFAETPTSVFRPDGTYSHAFYGRADSVAAGATARIAHAYGGAFTVGYPNGTVVASVFDRGIHEGELRGPTFVALDNAGRPVVADSLNNRIQVFDPDGAFAFSFGSHGAAPGDFFLPSGVAVSPLDGRIVVADAGNNRIQVFALDDYDADARAAPPAATAVTSPSPRGVYREGDTIELNVHFTRPVLLSGQPPALALDTGAPGSRNAMYAGGNGTAMLAFEYTVKQGDATSGLAYSGAGALAVASLADAVSGADGARASLDLPVPGQPGSLSYLRRMALQALQGAAPAVANVASLVPDGLYAYGERVEIGVQFTEAVSVSTTGGTPYLALDFAGERRAAPYVNGSGSDTLVFGYVVGYNDRHAGLNYTGPSALSDGGGTITGASGLHADLGLPAPGSPGSLSANSRLAIGVAPPRTVKPVVLFGAEGSAPGNFSGTLGVAVSPIDGSIVVADRENHRIQVFDPDGAFAFGLNSSGSAGGEFKFPRGVAVALDGRIAVADTGNHRIQVFHPNGTFDFKFTTHNGGGERLAPSDVAVDPRGWFVVGSVFDGRSTVSGFAETPTSVFRPDGTYSHAFYGRADSVAAGATARIAHAYGGAFTVGYPNGTVVASVFDRGIHEGELRGPTFVALDNAGRPVVADSLNNRIQVFDPDGAFAFSFGSHGAAPGDFFLPSGVAVSPLDGRIVVADAGNNRIQVFALDDYDADARAAPPAATAVTSPSPRGVYREGDTIELNVHFTRPVLLSGQPPALALDTGAPGPRNAMYAGGNGTAILRFSYTVQPYDSTGGLGYAGSAALVFPSATAATGMDGHAAADPNLPAPGTPGSLAYSADIRLDGFLAAVVSVSPSASTYDGVPVTLGSGDRMDIDVVFNRPVSVSTTGGTPYLLLRVGDVERVATYVAGGQHGGAEGGHQRAITFRYEVGTGEFADALDYASRNALVANGTAVTSVAGYPADLTLPAPGTRGSLSAGSTISVRAPAAVVDPPTDPPVDQEPDPPGPGGAQPTLRNMTVSVGPDAAAGGPINATGAGDGLRLLLNVTGLAADGGSNGNGEIGNGTVTFPPDEVVVVTSFAEVSFPPNVTATSVPADGLLALHIATSVPDDRLFQDALSYGGSGRIELRTVVEVGDANTRVQFDMPVRILLEGQAGGRAFYIDGTDDRIVPIDMACAADDTARVHRQMGGAGECQMDSADGADKIIYTYHLTRFGTVLSESAVPPPVVHTCSMEIAAQDLGMSARLGGHSHPVRQNLINTGSLPFTDIELDATPYYIDWGGDSPPDDGHSSLPASITEVSAGGQGGPYGPIADGGTTAVAVELGGGEVAALWFRANLSPHGGVQASSIVQYVTYQAQCGQ